jgi:pyruvate,orthophosphate dikinase
MNALHAAADRRIVVPIGVQDDARPGAQANAEVVGFKARNLLEMSVIGLRVPPAFVLGTGFCTDGATPGEDVWRPALDALETKVGLRFGDRRRPMLLSVRSGAPVSMPGMMETLLNIGLTDETLPGLVRLTGNPRMAWDSYRRLIASYGEVVGGIEAAAFDADLASVAGDASERELDFDALRAVARQHLATFQLHAGRPFPQDPGQQLQAAIAAVFNSWFGGKAVAYRELRRLPHDMGTAVTVQCMVFGNAGGLSGAGVGFTRNPNTGDPAPWIDFLFNAQGEDVVSGRRSAGSQESLAVVAPQVSMELAAAAHLLEGHFRDMQDFEFTVQEGTLFLLQTRDGKRTPQAAARIALDLLQEGIVDEATAQARTADLTPAALSMTRIVAAGGEAAAPLAVGTIASNGVACGDIALDETAARNLRSAGGRAILVRRDAETADIAALDLADGLLTQRGARTAHAAVVARQLGKVCIVSCEAMEIDPEQRRIRFGDRVLAEGDTITLDGNSGQVYAGAVAAAATVPEDIVARLDRLHGRP